jgi:hemoglobin
VRADAVHSTGQGGIARAVRTANRAEDLERYEMTDRSLYERLGGEPAVEAAVDVFYRKVLMDDRIAHHFDTVDMAVQRAKQKAFLTFAFGGPPPAAGGPSLREAHARLALGDGDFAAVMEHLGATLAELSVSPELIAEAAGIANSVKNDVLNR